MPRVFAATPAANRPRRMQVSSGSTWERICGYSPQAIDDLINKHVIYQGEDYDTTQ